MRQGVLLEAYRVASSVPLPQLATGSYTVIDGFDEVPASSAHQPIELALERLHSQGIEAFVITCRAADLAAVQKERAIVAWTGRKPSLAIFNLSMTTKLRQWLKVWGRFLLLAMSL